MKTTILALTTLLVISALPACEKEQHAQTLEEWQCEQTITVPGTHARVAFIPETLNVNCMDIFAGQGWRIVSTRRAQGGSSYQWGQEVTFQR